MRTNGVSKFDYNNYIKTTRGGAISIPNQTQEMQKGNIKRKTWWVTKKATKLVKWSKYRTFEKKIRKSQRLLRTNLLFSPAGKATVALDCEAVAAVSAAEPANAGA